MRNPESSLRLGFSKSWSSHWIIFLSRKNNMFFWLPKHHKTICHHSRYSIGLGKDDEQWNTGYSSVLNTLHSNHVLFYNTIWVSSKTWLQIGSRQWNDGRRLNMRKITGIFTIAIPNLHATFLKHPNESMVSQKALQIWETQWTNMAMGNDALKVPW